MRNTAAERAAHTRFQFCKQNEMGFASAAQLKAKPNFYHTTLFLIYVSDCSGHGRGTAQGVD